ncbi:MAG TPA: TIGR01440 family protein [Candidatus Enterocloster faecavium]|uniref:UPF0340 protein H9716_03715 n=1 Tax=Candidatus Enterocloster faecavium TaxID=2838560 RepID=A0A9D2RK05_9FIRM|nr:TIGR01440 family protein [Candidatus Enterocloster faecavium]
MEIVKDQNPDEEFLEQIRCQTGKVMEEFLAAAKMKPGQVLVVGCSSSEVGSFRIGSHSSSQIGRTVFDVLWKIARENGLALAAQCCEHLNRALILEEETALRYGWEIVNVVPQLKAGGSFATAAYSSFAHPAAVEHIKAHGGIDIGDTLIGMHLKDVAIPLRISQKEIGGAHVVCARTRAKLIGGERACYDPDLT